MAGEDERDWEKRQEQAFSILFQARRRVEADEVNLDSRILPWCRHSELVTLVCDDPPNRGTVTLTENGWFWQACVERPKRLKQWNGPLMWLEDALKWTEQELLAARAQSESRNPDSRRESVSESVDPSPMIDLTPYRIDPADLEPDHVTYRAVIEVDHIPTKFETIELSFGESIRYDEHYPSPSQLARELDLDLSKVKIEQLGGAYGVL